MLYLDGSVTCVTATAMRILKTYINIFWCCLKEELGLYGPVQARAGGYALKEACSLWGIHAGAGF